MKKFNVAGASFRTEKIDFVLEKYYKDKSKQNSDSYFVDNQPQKHSKYPVFITNKVQLIPEPENKHDENAIKVLIDDVHLGYVPRTQTEEIHKEIKDENEYIAEIKEDIKNQYSIEISISKK